MRYAKAVVAVVALAGFLGACSRSHQTVRQAEGAAPAARTLEAEINSLKRADLDRCFKRDPDGGDVASYKVVFDNKNNKLCAIMLGADQGRHATPALVVMGMSNESCQTKILSCTRPAAARKQAQ